MILQKLKEITHNTLLVEQKTKMLTPGSKSRVHKGVFLNPQGEEN